MRRVKQKRADRLWNQHPWGCSNWTPPEIPSSFHCSVTAPSQESETDPWESNPSLNLQFPLQLLNCPKSTASSSFTTQKCPSWAQPQPQPRQLQGGGGEPQTQPGWSGDSWAQNVRNSDSSPAEIWWIQPFFLLKFDEFSPFLCCQYQWAGLSCPHFHSRTCFFFPSCTKKNKQIHHLILFCDSTNTNFHEVLRFSQYLLGQHWNFKVPEKWLLINHGLATEQHKKGHRVCKY